VAAEPIIVTVDRDLQDLIPLFMAQRQADQAAIADALLSRNFEALRKIGHNMNGAGASYGFERISDLGERLTQAARAGDVAAIDEIKHAFDDYMERLVVK
jgi:HPt (histidine-containing phosphotransfer) domain-containing protein